MTDPYKILCVDRTASEDDIKKAYRKLAMKYHPDRADGNDAKFKELNQAYEQIKDGPPKYEGPTFGSAGRSTSDFNFNPEDIIADIMSGRRRHEDFSDILREKQRHMAIHVTAQIPLKDAVLGGEQYMQIPINNKMEAVKLTIPAGLMDGEKAQYPGIANGRDVIVRFKIIPDPDWETNKLDLIKQQDISIWDLIVGGALDVSLLDGSVIRLKIPPKTQPGTTMRIKGKGLLSRINNTTKGDMLVRLNAKIPDTIPEPLLAMIQELSG